MQDLTPEQLEDAMREQLRIHGDSSRTRAERTAAWNEYRRLHSLRTPETIERMEREGLVSAADGVLPATANSRWLLPAMP